MLKAMQWFGTTSGSVALFAVALAVPARADVADLVNCVTNPTHPSCTIAIEEPGGSEGGSGGGSSGCRNWQGQAIPCNIPGKGWYGGDGCWYKRAEGLDLAAAEAFGGKVSPPDAWYVGSCGDPITNFWPASYIRYRVFGGDPAIELLAQEAVRHLRLPAPQIRLNPATDFPQVVYVPTWMWVDEAVWSPRRATASLAGLSVTAVGTPTAVTWSTGDGGSRQCGRGTPWRAGTNPASASPDCGHTYTSPSRGGAGGAYTVTATITWRVTWSGGGTSGTEPDLTSTAGVAVQVVEASAVNTKP
ncbi:hypothetical protein [Plantactinospora sp. CA-290183]|uniref:hypothetical protein n=1 Tax=Plantactinospora sp. CA-290183 TaxID=3240006 RepID=UPI003D93A876